MPLPYSEDSEGFLQLLLLHHVTPTPQFVSGFGPTPATLLCVSDLVDFFEGTILSCLKQGLLCSAEECAGWQGWH